jgi:DNA helicase-2/ATP-dependent DNA helicase PcrA
MEIPTCPKCNAAMLERKNKKTGMSFYGCSMYPKCNGMRPMRYEKTSIIKKDMPQNIIGTPQQDAIWDSIKSDNKHIIVNALAGTGKTFTIVYALQYLIGLRVRFLAFNKDIITELQSRIPEGIEASTMNSFGFANVKMTFPKIRFNQYKLDDTIKAFIHEDDREPLVMESIARLVNLCKYNLLDGKNREDLDLLCMRFNIDLNNSYDLVYSLVPQVLKATVKNTKEIDFVDQLYFIYAHNLPVMKYDVLLGDEIQDWNKLQQEIAMRAIGSNGRFVGVGDPNQAIYGFAGADTNSIPNMIAMLENTKRGVKTMPLTYTRRCPKLVVDLAKEIVPDLEAMPEAIDGLVETITLDHAIELMGANNMGICRRNAPLIAIAYQMIRMGKSVIVKGRDIGTNLLNLISKLKANTIEDLIEKAYQYYDKEKAKLEKKGNRAESQIQSLTDKIDTLIALCEGKNSIEALTVEVQRLFQDISPNNAIVLSSMHKSKGLESESVFILQADKIKIPMNDPEFWQQELNLEYVAKTRSKKNLYLVIG